MGTCMSEALKLGYKRYVMVCPWWGKGNRSGMLADAQMSWHDSTAQCVKVFPTQNAETDNSDII